MRKLLDDAVLLAANARGAHSSGDDDEDDVAGGGDEKCREGPSQPLVAEIGRNRNTGEDQSKE